MTRSPEKSSFRIRDKRYNGEKSKNISGSICKMKKFLALQVCRLVKFRPIPMKVSTFPRQYAKLKKVSAISKIHRINI